MSFNLICTISGHSLDFFYGKDDHGRCAQESTCTRCHTTVVTELKTPHNYDDWRFIEFNCNASSVNHLLRKKESRRCLKCKYVEIKQEEIPIESLPQEPGLRPHGDGCNQLTLCPKCKNGFFHKISDHEFQDQAYSYHDKDSCEKFKRCKNCGATQVVDKPEPHNFVWVRLNDPNVPCEEKKRVCQHCGYKTYEHDHNFQDVDMKLEQEIESEYHGGTVYIYKVNQQCLRCGLLIQVEARGIPDERDLSYEKYDPSVLEGKA